MRGCALVVAMIVGVTAVVALGLVVAVDLLGPSRDILDAVQGR